MNDIQNNQPIGIFDSGIGGLSVLKQIRQLLPDENLIYIADSAYAPYGNKPHEFILQRCDELTRFLIEKNAKAIVIACNTATAVTVKTLRQEYPLPIIAMEPGVKPAIEASRKGIVGVLATENTLASEQFENLVHQFAKDVKVITQPCPGLVECIEEGAIDSDKTSQLIQKYTAPLIEAGADTIVLGCTHYPLIDEQIREVLGGKLIIIETGRAVAEQLKRKLEETSLLNKNPSIAETHIWTSGKPDKTGQLVKNILQQTCPVSSLPELAKTKNPA